MAIMVVRTGTGNLTRSVISARRLNLRAHALGSRSANRTGARACRSTQACPGPAPRGSRSARVRSPLPAALQCRSNRAIHMPPYRKDCLSRDVACWNVPGFVLQYQARNARNNGCHRERPMRSFRFLFHPGERPSNGISKRGSSPVPAIEAGSVETAELHHRTAPGGIRDREQSVLFGPALLPSPPRPSPPRRSSACTMDASRRR